MKRIVQLVLIAAICFTTAAIYHINAAPTITVKIDIGRKSKNCTGFGVCSVTIGVELDARATNSVSGVGELNDKELIVKLNRKIGGGNENMITADQPIKVAVQGKQVTIAAGSHRIERGRNTDTVYFNLAR